MRMTAAWCTATSSRRTCCWERDGVTKLVDLGIATAVDQTRITHRGTVLGTAAYMAPEQLEGGEVGPSTDIYALAAVLYEALAGRAPPARANAARDRSPDRHRGASGHPRRPAQGSARRLRKRSSAACRAIPPAGKIRQASSPAISLALLSRGRPLRPLASCATSSPPRRLPPSRPPPRQGAARGGRAARPRPCRARARPRRSRGGGRDRRAVSRRTTAGTRARRPPASRRSRAAPTRPRRRHKKNSATEQQGAQAPAEPSPRPQRRACAGACAGGARRGVRGHRARRAAQSSTTRASR